MPRLVVGPPWGGFPAACGGATFWPEVVPEAGTPELANVPAGWALYACMLEPPTPTPAAASGCKGLKACLTNQSGH